MSVHYDNPNNSTYFTNCCDVAILDYEKKCPLCSKEIASAETEHKTRMMRMNICNRTAWWGRR